MKKLLMFSVLLAFISIIAFGQIEKPIKKGNIMTGGSFGFAREKYKHTLEEGRVASKTKTNRFEVDLYGGYFILKHFSIGLKIDYVLLRRKEAPDYDFVHSYDYLILNPFVRYYLSSGFFGEGSVGYGFENWQRKESKGEKTIFNWNIGIGYSLFVNKNIAVEPKVYYSFIRMSETYLSESITENADLKIQIGLQYYFNLNKKNNNIKKNE
jgi:hypothetical protein